MAERAINLGLDFGTSNSSIAAVVNGELRIIPVQTGELTQPSCIFLDASDLYNSVGYLALYDFQRPDKYDNFHFVPTIKPGLHLTNYSGVTVESKYRDANNRVKRTYFPVVRIAGMILGDLNEFAKLTIRKDARNVVIGRPVKFSSDLTEDQLAQNRLESAAKEVGFEEVQFLYEPVAAGLNYERSRQVGKEEKVLVFDFGGGTLDISCLSLSSKKSLTEQEINSRVLSAFGIDLGGNDLDKDVFRELVVPLLGVNATWGVNRRLHMPRHYYTGITEWHLSNYLERRRELEHLHSIKRDHCSDPEAVGRLITMLENQHVFGVLQAIEQAKIALTESLETGISYSAEDLTISIQFTRAQFEAIVSPRIKQIDRCIDECLSRAQLTAEQIDTVLKVGGSSVNPFVNRYLKRKFPTVVEADVFNSVVAGLALAANEMFKV